MTGNRLFVDTPALIYLIEKNPAYFSTVSLFFADSN